MRCTTFWGDHAWPPWSDPEEAERRNGLLTLSTLVQRRRCRICGLIQVHEVGDSL